MVEIGRVRVKTGNAPIEQKISAYPPQADICAFVSTSLETKRAARLVQRNVTCLTYRTTALPLYERVTLESSPSEVAAADQRLAQSSIAATASISISHPGRIRRLTTTNVLAGGLATLR